MKSRKTLSNWLTNRYLLIIRNEENFAEKTTIGFTYAKLIFFSFIIFVALFVLSLYLSRSLMAQWFDPRYETFIMSDQIIQMRIKLDSLEDQVRTKEQFVSNMQSILRGEVPGDGVDSGKIGGPRDLNLEGLDNLPSIDSSFRSQFEKEEVAYLTVSNSFSSDLEAIYFFKPIEGVVSREFNMQIDHYGTDIVAKENENIMSVADGTVIFSSWTQDAGNVIAVQHRGNIISIYKHNSVLLKKVGNFVQSGEVISIVGNTGDLTSGPHLHFELWYNGKPMNPEDFISF